MLIRKLTTDDIDQYYELRLQALQHNPEVFGSTYEREINYSSERILAHLEPIDNEQFIIGAFDAEQKLIGIVSFRRERSPKMRHKGVVYGMYVLPEIRNQSVGLQLLMHFVRECEMIEGLERLNLSVVSTNESAIALYEKVGFEHYGHEKRALKYLGKYYDENLMVIDVDKVHIF